MNLLLKISDEGCNKYHRPNAKAYYKWDTCFSSLNEGKKIDFSMHYRQERIQVRTDAIYSIEPLRKFLYTVTFLTHKYWTVCCLSIMNWWRNTCWTVIQEWNSEIHIYWHTPNKCIFRNKTFWTFYTKELEQSVQNIIQVERSFSLPSVKENEILCPMTT